MPGINAKLAVDGVLRSHRVFGVVAVATSLITVPLLASPLPDTSTTAVRLTSVHTPHSPLGDGTALVMGPTGIPTPSQGYVDSADTLYLQPHGFTGIPEALFTPEVPAVNGAQAIASETEGARLLTTAIQEQIVAGQVDAENPVVVFGYSQSSALSTFTMQHLHDQGVPSDYVHFVLVGNPATPNGGLYEILGATPADPNGDNPVFGNPTPDNLYPTDVYTLEYDGVADFPRYPIFFLSYLNAVAGIFFEHLTYLGLSPEQIANAIPLETTGDTLVNYYMIPSESLPLLDPLRLIPVIGQPLYDLWEPETRILVNLGYGSITEGWNQGPANVDAPLGLFPTDLNWSDVSAALTQARKEGISAFINDLQNPDTYQQTPIVENPVIAPLITAAYQGGFITNPDPASLWDLFTPEAGGASDPSDGAALFSSVGDLADLFSQI